MRPNQLPHDAFRPAGAWVLDVPGAAPVAFKRADGRKVIRAAMAAPIARVWSVAPIAAPKQARFLAERGEVGTGWGADRVPTVRLEVEWSAS